MHRAAGRVLMLTIVVLGAIWGGCTAFGAGSETSDGGTNPNDATIDTLLDGTADTNANADGGAPNDAGKLCIDAGGYCIEATEVTRADYLLFLGTLGGGTDAAAVGLPPECAYKTTHVPSVWPPAAQDLARPVTGVDWCDAYAYCAAVGRRLCGAINGGPVFEGDRRNGAIDQWYRACSRLGERLYPYGNDFEPTRCNGKSAGEGGVVNVGAFASCVGGFDGLYDMSGNVFEWENSCSGATGADDLCVVRGGSIGASPEAEQLACAYIQLDQRQVRISGVGFRCCSLP